MKNLRAFAVTSTLTLFLAASAFAADPAGTSANPSASSAASSTSGSPSSAGSMSGSTDATLATSAGSNASLLQKASDLIGKSVINPQRQDLGKISDIMIDPSTGRVAYMVLSSGGFLGMGGKLYAVPLSAFHPVPGQDKLALNIDKDKLMNAPGFDTSHWPNMANREWGTQVHQYYGVTPYWEGSSSGGMGAEGSNMSGAAGSAGAGSASSSAAAHPSSQTSSPAGNR